MGSPSSVVRVAAVLVVAVDAQYTFSSNAELVTAVDDLVEGVVTAPATEEDCTRARTTGGRPVSRAALPGTRAAARRRTTIMTA